MMNNTRNSRSWEDDDDVEEELRKTIRIGKLVGVQFEQVHQHNLRESIKADKAKVRQPSNVTKPSTVTKASTSKSNRGKGKKSKFVPKPKQRWQVKKPTANWLELPSDLTANILQRIGVFDILQNAQKVCSTWRKICKDPAMWRVISMNNPSDPSGRPLCQEICKHVVDRSQGQLVDLSITDFCTDELLLYISERSGQLKSLEVIYCFGEMYGQWGEYLKKLPLLEELSLETTDIGPEDIEAAGRYCPMLKTLKANQKFFSFSNVHDVVDETVLIWNETAIEIGKNLHELRHLELIGDSMSNIGLQAILNGCPHVESLDIRQCSNVDLKKDDIGKRCSERIKDIKVPNDSLEGYSHLVDNKEPSDVSSECGFFLGDSDDDYYGYFDSDGYEYDDYTAFDEDGNFNEFEDLNDMMAFFSMFE